MNRFFLIVIVCVVNTIVGQEAFHVAISAQHNEKAHILLALIGKKSSSLDEVSQLLKKALEFKDQCTVSVSYIPSMMTKQEALAHKTSGYNYILFLENEPTSFAWHLFDIDEGQMKKNTRVQKDPSSVRASSYALADSIWHAMTGESAFFSSKIAYTKEIPAKKGLHYAHVYIADYDGSNAQPIVVTPTINVAPRWNKDLNRPLLFYSENTNSNMRMMAVDMHKKRVVASNFDGLNMLPTFSCDGAAVVYCATRGSGSCQLYHWAHKKLKKLTNNDGNNFAPVFSEDGTMIFFSSDFETGKPQIFSLHLKSNELSRLTKDGYCVSPSYCAVRNKLAYAKLINGVMQLFIYDLQSKQHKQITFDAAQKEECAWSNCGNFLLCPVDDGKKSRVAYFNVNTNEYKFITGHTERCSNPSLSCIYNSYPALS